MCSIFPAVRHRLSVVHGGAFFVVREDGAIVSVSRTGGRVPIVLVFRCDGVLIG